MIFWREKRKKKRGEEKEEERKKKPRPNRYRRQGANLIDALQCLKGATLLAPFVPTGALPTSNWIARAPLSLAPYYALGRQDGWRPVLRSRYDKSLPMGLFVKNVF
jgi:hypothetical protein